MKVLTAAAALSAGITEYARVRRRKGLLGRAVLSRAWRPLLARLRHGGSVGLDSPLIATVAITAECPLSCRHCSAERGRVANPSTAVLERTLDAIVRSGAPVIALTGGEPLLHPELLRLIDRIPSSRVVLLYTSGAGLTDELVEGLRARPHLVVCFSLDHLQPAEHDRRRGSVGTHAGVISGIERLTGHVAEVQVSSLVTRDRLAGTELIDFAHMLRRHGVACLQLFVPKPVGRMAGRHELCLSAGEEAQLIHLARQLNDDPAAPIIVAYPTLQHAKALGCCGGYARVYVDAAGRVCPCDFAPISFGNVNEEPFADIWARMRRRFERPGSVCLATAVGVGGNDVSMRSPPPGVFETYGEHGYRVLLGSLTLASVAL